MEMEYDIKDARNYNRSYQINKGGGPPKPLSEIICFHCGELGHYAGGCSIKKEDESAHLKDTKTPMDTSPRHVGKITPKGKTDKDKKEEKSRIVEKESEETDKSDNKDKPLMEMGVHIVVADLQQPT